MTTKRDIEAEVRARFATNTAEHELTILRDDGVYRHLRFRKPGASCYSFDIATWPGHLAITGDMGAAVFTRLDDMFDFFRCDASCVATVPPDGLYINPGYWAEKCVANDGEKKEFSAKLFERLVNERVAEYIVNHADDDGEPEWAASLREDAKELVLGFGEDFGENTASAISAMNEFTHEASGFQFRDPWEDACLIEHYTHHFIWRLLAIAYAVKAYDAAKVPA